MAETMTAQEAIEYVAAVHNISSMYEMSKQLSDDKLTVQPIQISNYMNGGKMSRQVADRFFEVYEVIISDVHQPGVFQK